MAECREFLKEKHAKYFLRCLNALPSSLASLDPIRYCYYCHNFLCYYSY